MSSPLIVGMQDFGHRNALPHLCVWRLRQRSETSDFFAAVVAQAVCGRHEMAVDRHRGNPGNAPLLRPGDGRRADDLLHFLRGRGHGCARYFLYRPRESAFHGLG
jgi:hypothetical protein